jgi:hypothetical protein
MNLHVPIADDLASILDRVLDKSIVVESSILLGLHGIDAKASVASSAVYVGYGAQGSCKEGGELEELFPFWRRDLWSK